MVPPNKSCVHFLVTCPADCHLPAIFISSLLIFLQTTGFRSTDEVRRLEMAAVVRVKRHLNQEPAEALLLAASSKRFKADTEEKSVFKFCGTVEKQVSTIFVCFSRKVNSIIYC